MKKTVAYFALFASTLTAHAEYRHVDLTVFGMDCAPCAHAIHVSMKGIPGVHTVEVDLNTGLVSVGLNSGSSASIRQFDEAVEKNGFTHKDATIVATGKITGTAAAPFFEVSGTEDRFALQPAAAPSDVAKLLGKTVTISGTLPLAPRGKVPDILRYTSIAEAQ